VCLFEQVLVEKMGFPEGLNEASSDGDVLRMYSELYLLLMFMQFYRCLTSCTFPFLTLLKVVVGYGVN